MLAPPTIAAAKIKRMPFNASGEIKLAAIPPSEKDPAIRAEKHSIAKCARSAAVTGTIPLATFATVLLTKLYNGCNGCDRADGGTSQLGL